ncbi:MAG: NADPH:quinone oxidoreductase family protein [Rhodospirillaceae bacterium]
MRAVLCQGWGGPASLAIEEVPEPTPGPGQISLTVAAAGLNFADTLMIAGKYQEKPAFPFSPGLEVAGTVRETGPGVTGFTPGQRVMAVLDHGGFAEQVLARTEDVFPIPESMDFTTAASFPIAYGTSHLALWERAKLMAGEILLVHGAAGGVGLTAVEIGKALGATVIASANGRDRLDVPAARGADHLIDTKTEDIRTRVRDLTGGRGVDVVYDPVGGEGFDKSLRSVAWGARLLTIGFASGTTPQIPANLLLVKNCAVIGLYWGSYRRHAPELVAESFRRLFSWFESGQLRPLVSRTFPLEAAAEALQSLAERRATGKLVLAIAPP